MVSILGVCTLLTLGAWIFLALESNSLRQESIAVEKKIFAKTAESTHLSSMRNVIKSSKSDVATIEKHFIKKDSVPQFIDMLESEAVSVGVKADFGSIDVLEEGVNSGALRIRMSGTGSWTAVTRFITTIETLPYASKVEGMTLSKSDTKSANWNFNLELIQYLSADIQ
jgi:Tfp pilus assembly protein PilO